MTELTHQGDVSGNRGKANMGLIERLEKATGPDREMDAYCVLLPIAAAGRILRERHLLERKRRRVAWELENQHWRELGEDQMTISADIYNKPVEA